MAYQGYDPFNDIGSVYSTDLQDHVIITAAYNLDASRFELLISAMNEGQTGFTSLAIYSGTDPATGTLLARLNTADADYNNAGSITLDGIVYPDVGVFTWEIDNPLANLTDYDEFTTVLEGFSSEQQGEDIIGVVQWPFLDMGMIGSDKSLVGFDLVTTAPEGVAVSVGFNQRNLADRTPDYAVEADTVNGMLIPLPLTAPSFDLKLTFAPGQAWEFFAANLYYSPLRSP